MAEFVAIDFETANHDRSSACAVGLAKVKQDRVTDTYYSLIRPPLLDFNPHFIDIHGITPNRPLRNGAEEAISSFGVFVEHVV